MSLSILSLSILANNPEMEFFIELVDTPFPRLVWTLLATILLYIIYLCFLDDKSSKNTQSLLLTNITKFAISLMVFLCIYSVALQDDYNSKTVHKMDVINSPYYQSLSDLDKSFVRISLMGDNADRFLNELPPMQDFNYKISLKQLDELITQSKQNHLVNSGEKPKDENFIKNQELIKALTLPHN